MTKNLLLGLAASLLTTWSAPALAITHRTLAPVDPTTRGVAVVRGGEVPDGCVATALSDRWVMVPREVYVDGRGRRCVGVDAAHTTVSFGAGTFAASALVERPGDAIRVDAATYPAGGGLSVTPVLVYLSAPLPGGSFPAVASSALPQTGGARRGLYCVGRTPGGFGGAAMAMGGRNESEGGVTTYRTRNNWVINSGVRGAVFTADADLGAPCFDGASLVGFQVALQNLGRVTSDENASVVVGLAEQRAWITSAMANPPVSFRPEGTWNGVHPHWSHPVIVAEGGEVRGPAGEQWGRWTFDGRTLVLNWRDYGPEPVYLQADGSFASADGAFRLTRAAAATLPGTWSGVHPHWSDAVILEADGTYHRGNGDPGRWTFDGRTLVLNWTNWGPEPVVLQADGSFASADGHFTLRRR